MFTAISIVLFMLTILVLWLMQRNLHSVSGTKRQLIAVEIVIGMLLVLAGASLLSTVVYPAYYQYGTLLSKFVAAALYTLALVAVLVIRRNLEPNDPEKGTRQSGIEFLVAFLLGVAATGVLISSHVLTDHSGSQGFTPTVLSGLLCAVFAWIFGVSIEASMHKNSQRT